VKNKNRQLSPPAMSFFGVLSLALLSPTCMILSASKHKGRELAPTAGGVPTGREKAEAETKAFISAYSRMFLSKSNRGEPAEQAVVTHATPTSISQQF